MTFIITCPCDCGSHVEASDAGFSATSVTVDPCPALAAAGVVSSRLSKSAAYAAAIPADALRHASGLVTMDGAA